MPAGASCFFHLLEAQRDHGIDAHGAACRQVAGDERDGGEQEANGGEGDGVGGAGFEKYGAQESREPEAEQESDQQADENQPDAVAEDEAEDVLTLRAEGEANADFVGALPRGVGNEAVDSDGCQN